MILCTAFLHPRLKSKVKTPITGSCIYMILIGLRKMILQDDSKPTKLTTHTGPLTC